MLIFLMMRTILSQMLKFRKDTRTANVRVFFLSKSIDIVRTMVYNKMGKSKDELA